MYEEHKVVKRLRKLDLCVDPHDGRCALKCNRVVDCLKCDKVKCPSIASCPCYKDAKDFAELKE